MTTRYRVEYALKKHRRDDFIEWIKGLLAGPFVLHAGHGSQQDHNDRVRSRQEALRKYTETFLSIEELINEQMQTQLWSGGPNSEPLGGPGGEEGDKASTGRLQMLVPTIGPLFTSLPMTDAFLLVNARRRISHRRMVAPSFNDVRHILNTAQALALASPSDPSRRVQLVTFDGDLTLYADGSSLTADAPIVAPLVRLLAAGIYVGVVTAAGYPERSGEMYSKRLRGLIDAIMTDLPPHLRRNLLVMGAECHYMFRLTEQGGWEYIDKDAWGLPEMQAWSDADCDALLDQAETVLRTQRKTLRIEDCTQIVRKKFSTGIVPRAGCHIDREQLEEIVLNCHAVLSTTDEASRVHFCAFNGGADVWVDIGDKRYGVLALQRLLGGIPGSRTMHVGDQFASVGANDFRARLATCTVWICNPDETRMIIEELLKYMDGVEIPTLTE